VSREVSVPSTGPVSPSELQRRIDAVPFWFHSIDVGDGFTTPGLKSAEALRAELESLRIPNLRGKTVLDIGAWDGFYSFEAENRGAALVTALDHYVWSMDLEAHRRHLEESREHGVVPSAYHEMPYWKPDELPGKRGFDVAHELRRSGVKPIVTDFMATDLRALGTFDVVLFLGILYHMENPMESLRRLATVTGEVAIIETQAILVPRLEDRAICEFYESNELNYDVSNWWAPNQRALEGMCRAAGFSRVETVQGPRHRSGSLQQRLRRTTKRALGRRGIQYYRAVVHAWK
jgi:tRNA (mo5U34)-methyltransferase